MNSLERKKYSMKYFYRKVNSGNFVIVGEIRLLGIRAVRCLQLNSFLL